MFEFIVRTSLTALLLATASMPISAYAQQITTLQQQMGEQQFSAAGLDKLSPQELENLTQWLNAHIAQSNRQAAENAGEEVRRQARGFFDFGDNQPITSQIEGRFNGFAFGRVYRLANGQEWEQVDHSTLAGVRGENMQVRISPGILGAWYLHVGSYSTRAKVRRVK